MWAWVTQHRWLVSGIGVVGIVIAIAVGVWFLLLRSPGTPFNLRQALRWYRAGEQAEPAPQARDLPPPGVYRYRTTGGEQLSVASISRRFPSDTDMIVTDHSCATVTWVPLEQHVEETVVCPSAGGSWWIPSSGSTEQIAGSTTTSVMRCARGTYLVPPGARPGARWSAQCTSPGLDAAVSGTVRDRCTVSVGGHPVRALHVHLTFTFSGDEHGTSPEDFWVSTSDGLILRQRELVDVSTPAGPLGPVSYTEEMEATLESETPVR